MLLGRSERHVDHCGAAGLSGAFVLTLLLVSGFQPFRGFGAPGQLVLLPWCACRLAWF